jgi:hypothetical protein
MCKILLAALSIKPKFNSKHQLYTFGISDFYCIRRELNRSD